MAKLQTRGQDKVVPSLRVLIGLSRLRGSRAGFRAVVERLCGGKRKQGLSASFQRLKFSSETSWVVVSAAATPSGFRQTVRRGYALQTHCRF